MSAFDQPSAPRTASAFPLSAQIWRVLPINRLARRPPTVSRLEVRRLRLHAPEQIGDAVCDVVTDQPHALDALDAALRGFVGVPVLELGSGDRLNVGLATNVTTMSTSRRSWGSTGCGVWSLMSTPTSASDWAERSLMAVPGLVPAEYTCTASPAILRIRPAAICDFPPFLTHTKSTEGVEAVSVIEKSVSWPGRCQSR